MDFSQLLLWTDLLGWGNLTILTLFALTLVVVPRLTILHLQALAAAEREQEHATYLATHDTLTALPNRMMLANVSNADEDRLIGQKILAATAAPIDTTAGPMPLCTGAGKSAEIAPWSRKSASQLISIRRSRKRVNFCVSVHHQDVL